MKTYIVYNLFSNNPILYAGPQRAKAKDIALRNKGGIQIWENGQFQGRLIISRGKWVEFNEKNERLNIEKDKELLEKAIKHPPWRAVAAK